MTLTEFEAIRSATKRIEGDVRLQSTSETAPVLVSDAISLANDDGHDVVLHIHHNPEIGEITFNVTARGTGQICRLDINSSVHKEAGRTHKHEFKTERCPERNLCDGVTARPDYALLSVVEALRQFCEEANISFEGQVILS